MLLGFIDVVAWLVFPSFLLLSIPLYIHITTPLLSHCCCEVLNPSLPGFLPEFTEQVSLHLSNPYSQWFSFHRGRGSSCNASPFWASLLNYYCWKILITSKDIKLDMNSGRNLSNLFLPTFKPYSPQSQMAMKAVFAQWLSSCPC